MKPHVALLVAIAGPVQQLVGHAAAAIDNKHSGVTCTDSSNRERSTAERLTLLGNIRRSGKTGVTTGCDVASGYDDIKTSGRFFSDIEIGNNFKFDAWANLKTSELYVCAATWDQADLETITCKVRSSD